MMEEEQKRTVVYLYDQSNGAHEILVADSTDNYYVHDVVMKAYDEWLDDEIFLDFEKYETFASFVIAKLKSLGINAWKAKTAEYSYE